MKKNADPAIRCGTDNVFADLGYADADTHMLKAQLVSRMHDIIHERKLTQTEVARITGFSQPDVSRVLKGQFRDVSVERIMRVLGRLGCEIDIVVKRSGSKAKTPVIHYHPAPV